MKKIFLSICFSLMIIGQVWAATREFNTIDEARENVLDHNKAAISQERSPSKLPQTEQELRLYLQKRSESLDLSILPDGEKIDKISSFSKIDDSPVENKSVWEKIYDGAMKRLESSSGANVESLQSVQYYTLKENGSEGNSENEHVPAINVQLSDGTTLLAPAYEHIPYFAAQIEILPSRMVKVSEEIVVVANGKKVKELLSRFIKKESAFGKDKIQVILDEVSVNGSMIPYKLEEENDYFAIRPTYQTNLQEGVYIFEFKYFVDRCLGDLGDFYEFYWNLTGGNYNLLVTRAIASVRLPGREPAVKQFALTGRLGALRDDNAAFMTENNIIGFMNLYPLLNGESLHVFLTIPKVDFVSLTSAQKAVEFLELFGDVVICALYAVIVVISCWLSWRYICHNSRFKNITFSSVVLIRSLWRGGVDDKSVVCALLDMFRKNIIDIDTRDDEILLVRKTVHSKNISKFELRILNVLFSKKDSVYKFSNNQRFKALKEIVRKESNRQIRNLGLKLSSMYIFANLCLLFLTQIGLVLWNPNSLMFGILCIVDVLLAGMFACFLVSKSGWKKTLFIPLGCIAFVLSALILKVYLSWVAVALFLGAVIIAFIFNQKVSGENALLKAGVLSVYQMRDFLLKQREQIGSGRNFIVQQANIFALDAEENYPNNGKIRNNYRLDIAQELLKKMF